jgi:hypothetical protein
MTADATCWQMFTLSNYVFTFLVPYCDVRCDFRVKTIFRFVWTSVSFVGASCFIYVICVYLRILVSNTISISDDVRVV